MRLVGNWIDVALRNDGEAEQIGLIDDLKQREHRLKTEVMMYKEVSQ